MSNDYRVGMPKAEKKAGDYTVYAAGGLFTQHDLATNVLIKKSVWKQSEGKYELVLPQSKELRDLDRPDIAAYIRNVDLIQVVKTDMFLARFDGLELDAGTVIEFMLAKFLGKATVILRCDSRRLGGESLDEPYNLMVKNWPRTVEIHYDSVINYVGGFAKEWETIGNEDTYQSTIEAEYQTVMRGIDEIAQKIIEGLNAVQAKKSPYPEEYQELVYKIAMNSPGSGFDQLILEKELEELIQRFKKVGTL